MALVPVICVLQIKGMQNSICGSITERLTKEICCAVDPEMLDTSNVN